MIHAQNPAKILKNIYSVPVIEEIDVAHIKSILKEFTYEKCKIVLVGNDVLTNSEV